jgi:hypothetical protein
LSTTTVSNIIPSSYNEYYVINNKLKITFEHPVLVKRNGVWSFRNTRDVLVGDMVINSNKETELVNSIDHVQNETVQVYTLDTEVHDVYFADNILVHNFTDKQIPD